MKGKILGHFYKVVLLEGIKQTISDRNGKYLTI